MVCQVCGKTAPELYRCGTLHEFATCVNCMVDLAGLALDRQPDAIALVRATADEIGFNNDPARASHIRAKRYGARTGLRATEQAAAH